MEPGEYAVRGGIVDVFPPGRITPVRLDFFGDTLEQMKAFDPETQRTSRIVQKLTLMPISEAAFGPDAEKRFRRGYVEMFGAVTAEDPLYEAISAGQRYPGLEHWLPLFHEHLETLFDYMPDAAVTFDQLADEAVGERLDLIREHYDARVKGLETLTFGAPPYKPVPAASMFLGDEEWAKLLGRTHRATHDGLRAGTRCLARRGALVPGPDRAQLRGRARRARPQRVRCHGRARAQSRGAGAACGDRRFHRRARGSGWRRCWPSTSSPTRARSTATPRCWLCRPARRRWPCSGSSRASRRRASP